jgi:hypothetical protein
MNQRNRYFQILYIQLLAFIIIIFISWGNELFNLAHYVLGGHTVTNWREAMFESIATVLVATPTIYLTWRLVKRIHSMEEYLKVCSWCSKIKSGDQWVALDEFLNAECNIETAQSICPVCVQKVKETNRG